VPRHGRLPAEGVLERSQERGKLESGLGLPPAQYGDDAISPGENLGEAGPGGALGGTRLFLQEVEEVAGQLAASLEVAELGCDRGHGEGRLKMIQRPFPLDCGHLLPGGVPLQARLTCFGVLPPGPTPEGNRDGGRDDQ
jgi:hypothetical protein